MSASFANAPLESSKSSRRDARDDGSDVDEDALADLSMPLHTPRSGPVDSSQYDNERFSGDLQRATEHDDDAAALLAEANYTEALPRPTRPRAMSFSRYSFDFGRNLLAIPLSVDIEPGAHAEKSLGLVSGVALVIGGQIGSGIFSTPGIIVSDVGSVGCSLIVWLAGGLLAWTGAATFSELGSAIPLNGGIQAYLNYSYGPLVAFLYSWATILGIFPGSTAAIGLATSEYLCRILYHTAFSADSEESARAIPSVVIKIIGLVILALAGFVTAISYKVSKRCQTILTALKLVSLIVVTVMGIIHAARGKASGSLRRDLFLDSSSSPGAYALALYSALFAYSGWDYINSVAGEMENAARDLPRVIHISVGMTIFLYFAANLSYFVVLEKPLVAHSNTVGLDFGKALLGATGGTLLAFAIALSSFGALQAAIWSATRVVAIAGQDGYLPSRIGEIHRVSRTPVNAIIFYCLLAALYTVVGNFKTLITMLGICAWFFYLLTAISLLILRIREPALERPYKTFLGWPLVFSGASIFILLMPLIAAPLQFLVAAAIITSGLPAYYLLRKRERLTFEKLYSSLPTFGHRHPRRREMSNGSSHASKAPDLPRVSEADEEEEEAHDDDDDDDDDEDAISLHQRHL